MVIKGRKTLLLHSCCAPCSSYVLEFLRGDVESNSVYGGSGDEYDITVFFYNPNITDKQEYELRRDEQKRLIAAINLSLQNKYAMKQNCGETIQKIDLLESSYNPDIFYEAAKGLENEPEGGARCGRCFELRLKETARVARKYSFDFFTTTLSVSPHKNAEKINEIGLALGAAYLPADFKKKGGYQRSIELSKEYGLYRQKFCGCEFSR